MVLQIYNTLTRRKEVFTPLNPPKVNMYVCGVTVYDECHLGHARALVNFDVIYRYLKYKGFDVTYVRNYTDVDDKIIIRAQKENIPWDEVAKKYVATFDRDMQALKNARPTHEPKATEHISEMHAMIEKLVTEGYAYKAGNDVFYSVRKKKDYGKLSGKNIDELESGARVEVHEAKKDPLDFALWKASKPFEPAWDSPWGAGRPGWHIECSAMSMKYLGETLDIHGGGRDLAFPHHENEIAQSEAYSGKPFARYWIHNGFVNINAEKMSKSLGNFLTIREILRKYHPEVLRLFVLSAHYRSPLDYSDLHVEAARQSLIRWYTTLERIQNASLNQKTDPDLEEKIGSFMLSEFEKAMDDDFNTAKVAGLLFDLAREWNRALDMGQTVAEATRNLFFEGIKKIGGVLGLFSSGPRFFLEDEKKRGLVKGGLSDSQVLEKIRLRNEARRTKDWKAADQIRKELAGSGIQLKDNPDGTTTWSAE